MSLVNKNDPLDPKGLVREAYLIEGITSEECRSIFLDWALSLPDAQDARTAIDALIDRHSDVGEGHPLYRALLTWSGLARQQRYEQLFASVLRGSGIVRREVFAGEDERARARGRHGEQSAMGVTAAPPGLDGGLESSPPQDRDGAGYDSPRPRSPGPGRAPQRSSPWRPPPRRPSRSSPMSWCACRRGSRAWS